MPAAQHHGGAGLGDAGNELRQRQPGLHIPAHRVEQHQQPLDAGVLLHRHQLGDDMLIFGGFLALGRFHMALHLPHYRQTVDGVFAPGAPDAAQVLDLLLFQPLLLHRAAFFVVRFLFHPPGRFFSGFPGQHGAIPKAKNLSQKILSKGFDILVSGCILYIN